VKAVLSLSAFNILARAYNVPFVPPATVADVLRLHPGTPAPADQRARTAPYRRDRDRARIRRPQRLAQPVHPAWARVSNDAVIRGLIAALATAACLPTLSLATILAAHPLVHAGLAVFGRAPHRHRSMGSAVCPAPHRSRHARQAGRRDLAGLMQTAPASAHRDTQQYCWVSMDAESA
jgi:hypothetical protein